MSLAALTLVAGVALDPASVTRYADLALDCVHREYPNKIAHVLNAGSDVRPPRTLTPVFWGCYDWHSSVHGHWMLARLARLYPDEAFALRAKAALARSLTPAAVGGEVDYLHGAGRQSFERPYGLAWLLQLGAELRDWDHPQAGAWSAALAPLEAEAARRFREWLPKLAYPIRTGEHSQTAFAFGLALDWARTAGDDELARLLIDRSRALYEPDAGCPLDWEPSGQDFLSPCLAQADLLRRVLAPDGFAAWLTKFLPGIPEDAGPEWLPVAIVTDRSDPKLAHLDGLNLSRAWMLEGIAAGLPIGDLRRISLRAAAEAHAGAGLAGADGEHYEGGHWLGSFATYLVTGRGLPADARGCQCDAGSPVELTGQPVQGGLIAGRVAPGTEVRLDGRAVPVGPRGDFLLGFGREAPTKARLEIVPRGREPHTQTLSVRQREYDIQRIDGLPAAQVTPPDEVLERIRVEGERVAAARAHRDERTDFLQGFAWPAKARISGVYGSQRILNGEPRQPHFGVDLALPRGAPVAAPADGVVTLAEPDLYFSGGTLVMDHGMGLTSSFLHLDRILVRPGERVRRGQVVGEVGATGRVTGPHLDWRMNLGDERLDPELVLEALPAPTPVAEPR